MWRRHSPGALGSGPHKREARRVSQPSRHFALTYRCNCTRRVDEHVDESKIVSFALSRAPLAHRSALGGARARVRAIIDGEGCVNPDSDTTRDSRLVSAVRTALKPQAQPNGIGNLPGNAAPGAPRRLRLSLTRHNALCPDPCGVSGAEYDYREVVPTHIPYSQV